MTFIQSVPAGLVLIPMFISALLYTIAPNLVLIGGPTEALLSNQSINFLIAAISFFSGLTLDFKSILKILKTQGSLLLVKVILAGGLTYLYISFFGVEGIFGISALALVGVLNASNPSMYIALMDDFELHEDKGAFGLIGTICLPTIPLFLFSLSQPTAIDWSPILSAIIPVILGVIMGNLDNSMRDFFKSGPSIIMPLLGWQLGYGINLIDALGSILQGIILVLLFYTIITIPMILFEKAVLKSSGVYTASMNTISGVTISVPALIAASNPQFAHLVPTAAAAVTLGVVLSSIITPILAKHFKPATTTQP